MCIGIESQKGQTVLLNLPTSLNPREERVSSSVFFIGSGWMKNLSYFCLNEITTNGCACYCSSMFFNLMNLKNEHVLPCYVKDVAMATVKASTPPR